MRHQRINRRVALLTFALVLVGTPFIAQADSTMGDSTVTSSGTFTGKSDHITTGGVTVLKTGSGYIVVLESDFSLDGAPDPKIGFGKNGKFAAKTLFTPLDNDKGLQVYELPKSVDPTKYNEVYIWCEKFNVPLGVADLK